MRCARMSEDATHIGSEWQKYFLAVGEIALQTS
jgi:hypothetical protein